MSSPESVDPLYRRSSSYVKRRIQIESLLKQDRVEEAMLVSGRRYAGAIYFLFQQNPHITTAEVARELNVSWPTAKTHLRELKDLGIPLGHFSDPKSDD